MIEGKPGGELTSWKEIADYLEISVRTAQRYEEEMGLPVRRVGGEKGRAVVAHPAELLAWRKKHVATHKWWERPEVLKRYAIASTVLVVVLGAYTARDVAGRLMVGKPAASEWLNNTLVVRDAANRVVFEKYFPGIPHSDRSNERFHGDLDNDGRLESVIPYVPSSGQLRDSYGGPLHILSDRGEELWKLLPTRRVTDRKQSFSRVYLVRQYRVVPSPEKDGTHWTVAVFVHHFDYPSVLLVADGKGKIRGEYWNSGHFDDLIAEDLDGDGVPEILAAGTSLGENRALVRVFDLRNVGGADVLPAGHPNQLQGFGPGTEKATILFARSRLNRSRQFFNYAYRIFPASTDSDGSFVVDVAENLTKAAGFFTYWIGRDLALRSVFASESLRATYREIALAGPGVRDLDETDLGEMRKGYEVRRRGK